jgi:choline-glycine betaine transporter
MVLTHIQNWIYANLSWSYILIVSFFLIFLFVLAFSKIGNIRLGADNSAPQYSFFSWIAMLFAAGMGIGLMYFGVAEPMSHYVNITLWKQKLERRTLARASNADTYFLTEKRYQTLLCRTRSSCL